MGQPEVHSREEPHLLQTPRRLPDRHRRYRRSFSTSCSAAPGKPLSTPRSNATSHRKRLLFAHRVETDKSHSLPDIAAQEGLAAGARATIIDASGKVLADSETDPANIENPLARKEFAAAARRQEPEKANAAAPRLAFHFSIIAVPVSGGAVRLAYPLSDVEAVQTEVRRRLLWGSAIAFIIALIIAGTASVWTSRRLERIVNVAARIAARRSARPRRRRSP